MVAAVKISATEITYAYCSSVSVRRDLNSYATRDIQLHLYRGLTVLLSQLNHIFCSDELRKIKGENERAIHKLDIDRERQSVNYDPFGRPGAGAPNRDENGM